MLRFLWRPSPPTDLPCARNSGGELPRGSFAFRQGNLIDACSVATGIARMQTQLMQPGKLDVPCFERAEGDDVERTPIQAVPFTIGRVETVDLQINSSRVSREHAVIVKQQKEYRIRDLGSTNGTFVNGARIDEVPLADGDVVVIADCEFTFILPESTENKRLVTQAMDAPVEAKNPWDRVVALRRLQESLLHRGFRPRLWPVFDLASGRVVAKLADTLEASRRRQGNEWLAAPLAACSSSLWHACQLHRTLAAEAYVEARHDDKLIIGIDAEEVEHNTSLLSHLSQLSNLVGEQKLVVSVPASVMADVHRQPLYVELKRVGHQVALGEFLGSQAQVAEIAASPPEYLILAEAMARDVGGSSRQRRQLTALAEACREIGTLPVVTNLSTREDEDACRELGFALATSKRAGRSSTTSPPPMKGTK
jgi:pSer/pThr/pTyr-binding forkhead associated (FHA) protein